MTQIGEIIRFLRKKKGMTQDELCNGICERRHLIRIEHDEVSPTFIIIDMLSRRLGTDIYSYCAEAQRHGSLEAHLKIEELNEYLSISKISTAKSTIMQASNDNAFKEGEPFRLLCYVKSIYSSNVDNDLEKAIEFALLGLNIKSPLELQSFDFSMEKYNNITSNLALTLCVNLCRYNDLETGIKLLNFMCNALEPYLCLNKYSIHKWYHHPLTTYCLVLHNLCTFDPSGNSLVLATKVHNAIAKMLSLNYFNSIPNLLNDEANLLAALDEENSMQCLELRESFLTLLERYHTFKE